MKTGGSLRCRLAVLRWIGRNVSHCSLLESWCRHISCLRAAALQRKSAGEASAGKVMWELLADSSKCLDGRLKMTSTYLEHNQHNSQEGSSVASECLSVREHLRPGGRVEVSYVTARDSRIASGGHGRIGSDGDAMKDEVWKNLCEGQLAKAVDVLDLLVQQAFHVSCSLLHRILERCIKQKDLALGRRVHVLTLRSGHGCNTFLANHIISLYACYGTLEEATEVFRNLAVPDSFSWCSIIRAYTERGQPVQAIYLYQEMLRSTVKPSSYIFVAVLKACIILADLAAGKLVHADILRSEFECDVYVGSCLVDMYAKCGSLGDARRVFDRLPSRNVVTWAAMISGYVQHGLDEEASTLLSRMQQEGIMPADRVTFASLLKACAAVGALQQGKQLHSHIEEKGLECDVVVGNCLVDMYAKCGNLDDARRVFNKLPSKDVVTWTALLYGYAEHNYGHMAVGVFKEMRQEGVRPDSATFTCLLVACSHEGLVDEAQMYLKLMVEEYGIAPNVKHYTCLVDLLGRSGRLDEAENLLQSIPFEDSVVGLTALLSACKSYGDVERAKRCFDQLTELAPESATAYVLLENTYASVGRWTDVNRIGSLRRSAGALKKPARAFVEIHGKVETFVVGEARDDISFKLKSVNMQVEESGHVLYKQVPKALSDQENEDALCGHAEKLALAYGLLNTPEGATLRVTKNLRMCNDCHDGTKVMSRIEKREIIVRDAHRVHHFIDGSCSCGDRQ